MYRFRKCMLFGILLVMLVFAYTGQCLAKQPLSTPPTGHYGVLDLTNTDFKIQKIDINGEWKFYWNSLKEPFSSEEYHEYIDFPKLWNNSFWKKKRISSSGFATYEVKILLPKKTPQLALKIPDVYCTYRLYVNDKLYAHDGKPGTTKETTIPHWSTQVVPLFETSDTLNLLLQISNFQHSKGGISQNIEIGSFTSLQNEFNINRASDFFLAGCVFMGGFFFLGLYLFGQHDRSILYFALFCSFFSYRIGGSGQYTLHDIFPDLNWNLTIHLEYLSLFLAVAMFVLYTRSLYPQDAPQKIMSIMAGICFGFGAITIISPPVIFTRLLNSFLVIVLLYIVFATYIYWIAAKKKRIGSIYAMLSAVAIFVIIISEMLEYYAIANPYREILFVSYLAFFFCQSLILSFKFASTLKKARQDAEVGLKVKSEFLSTMSHEIRTPLNSVIGTTHLMIGETPRPDQKKHLDVLLFSANNLLNIVNDVLDFSSIEEGKINFENVPMNISAIAENIMSGYKAAANNAKIDFILDLDKGLPAQISGDSIRTTQIIGNLVHNAIKFTNSGHVILSIKQGKRDENEITLKISVEDTGIGIASDKQKMIFERFTQADSSTSREFSGTGLGLTISKRILELQGITLHLHSELDKGSTFYYSQSFPIIKEEERITLPSRIYDKNPLSNIKILIVEDNPMNVLVLQNFLKRWGAEFELAQNGKEAIEIFDSSRHHIVLMDLHMPIMDGYEATRVLRSRGEDTPIIALTATVANDLKEQISKTGINDIVTKPFLPDNLLRVILNYVNHR